jgi:hypothetical protein
MVLLPLQDNRDRGHFAEPRMRRDAAIALSLANVFFLRAWAEILEPEQRSLLPTLPGWEAFGALALHVMLLAGLIWGVLRLGWRSENPLWRKLGRGAFVLILLVALNSVLLLVLLSFHPVEHGNVYYFVAATVTLLTLLVWPGGFVNGGKNLALIFSPFVLIVFLQAGWILASPGLAASYADKGPAPLLPVKNSSAPRIVWLVFDEMDQQMTFEKRPAGVELPALESFRRRAFAASHAYPPSRWTLTSMVAMFTGRLVSEARFIRPNELLLTWNDTGERVEWSRQPTVFSRARDAGYNTAYMGMYYPVCRVIGESLTACSWQAVLPGTLAEHMDRHYQILMRAVPFQEKLGPLRRVANVRAESMLRRKAAAAYLQILATAKKAAANPDLGLVLAHWPVPHHPGIYDLFKKDFTGGGDYFDNLLLVDRAVGEIRAALEGANLWDRTTVLVTSDHWWRPEQWRAEGGESSEMAALAGRQDYRIPFLLKLAGQDQSYTYEPAFNTVLTHDLLLAVLGGKVSTAEEAARWIEERRSSGEGSHDPICGPAEWWPAPPPPDRPCG